MERVTYIPMRRIIKLRIVVTGATINGIATTCLTSVSYIMLTLILQDLLVSLVDMAGNCEICIN